MGLTPELCTRFATGMARKKSLPNEEDAPNDRPGHAGLNSGTILLDAEPRQATSPARSAQSGLPLACQPVLVGPFQVAQDSSLVDEAGQVEKGSPFNSMARIPHRLTCQPPW